MKCAPGSSSPVASSIAPIRHRGGPRPLEPIVFAAVPQHHPARLGLALTTSPVLARPPLARGSDAGPAQDTANRLAAEHDSVPQLAELLGKVLVVKAGVGATHEIGNPLPHVV